jgi:hypothetical protein
VNATLKIEVGKAYRTRDGRKAVILDFLDRDCNYPIRGAIEGEPKKDCWKLDGRWSRFPGDSGFKDLVAEWVEPAPPAPQPNSNTLTEHSIMLGQIAVEVEEFCDGPHTTTLQAVLAMKAELYELRAKAIWARINTNKKGD